MKKLICAKMPVKNTEAIAVMLCEDDIPVELYIERRGGNIACGDIFVGYVEKIIPPEGGAFVRLSENERGYLPPSKRKNIVYKTAKKDDVMKPGDEIIVRIETESTAEKHAVLNCSLKTPGNKEIVDEIKEKGLHRPAGTCLYKAPRRWSEILDRNAAEEFSRIVTDDETVFEDLGGKAAFYDDKLVSLYKLYNLSTVLDRALAKKVWLSSGAYVFIERTEAFTVIDVNSGKISGRAGSEELFLKVNKEAADEIFRQLRLRHISGSILVDFISMKKGESVNELFSYCQELAEADPVYVNVVDITKLGIMEITRHKTVRPLAAQIAAL